MNQIIKQKHGGELSIPNKGEIRNPNGRPLKIYTILKRSGFSMDDIKEAYKEIAWQKKSDLEAIIKDDEKPIILKVLAQAFLKGGEKGDYRYINEIMQQAIGKPTEKIEANVNHFKITLNLGNTTD